MKIEKSPNIQLHSVGVKYRFLTPANSTIKGRVLGLLRRRVAPASEFWALRGVDLTVSSGEVLGVIGPNGGGKSTLLQTMARVIHPAEGTVGSCGAIRPLLDVMGTLNGALTAYENCRLYAALHQIPREEMAEFIPKVREFSELGPFFDVPVKCYSAGMVSRLAFSLATQFRPEILLVDEMLSVGDEHFQRKSYFRMAKLIEKGNLVVLVSHDLHYIQQVCTKAILLVGGKIIDSGAPRTIIARYRKEWS